LKGEERNQHARAPWQAVFSLEIEKIFDRNSIEQQTQQQQETAEKQ
jgi:hypothetical protein